MRIMLPPPSKSKGVGYKYGKIHREVAKEVCSTQRSRSLSKTMEIVHRRHEHFFRGHKVSHTTDSDKNKKISLFRATAEGTGK
jgi:23S rRNA maturation mini-RNase III